MIKINLYTSLFLLTLPFSVSFGQPDEEPPTSPILELVTINNIKGTVGLYWQPSSSTDICSYVVYNYQNNEGYAIDTINDPTANSYEKISSLGTGYFSQLYVVAAMDCSGNISPLSNSLGTIHATAQIDTCYKKLEINWSGYCSFPFNVDSYELFSSLNGGAWQSVSLMVKETTSFVLESFVANSNYCFKVIANLSNENKSESNIVCLNTRMQNPPGWINADWAETGEDSKMGLSFTIDLASEINSFILERKESVTSEFKTIANINSISGKVGYTDDSADPKKQYYYRLTAINNCGVPIVSSNIASNIVLKYVRPDDNTIALSWNRYNTWRGNISEQYLMVNTGEGYNIERSLNATDSLTTVFYSDYIQRTGSYGISFIVGSLESDNPYGITGESRSQPIFLPMEERITVPSLFTPDGNLVNDLFRPVLSFVPPEYYLAIFDINRKLLFESRDYMEEWDGTAMGRQLPEGVYLWQIRLKTAGGVSISRSGTIAIVFNP